MQGIGTETITTLLILISISLPILGWKFKSRLLGLEKTTSRKGKGIENPTQTILLFAGIILTIAGEGARQFLPQTDAINPSFLSALGILLFIGGLLPSNSAIIGFLNRILPSGKVSSDLPVERILYVLSSFALAIVAFLSAGDEWLMHSPYVAIISWLLSILLIVLAFIDWKEIEIEFDSKVIYTASALFLVAFVLRYADLNGIPNTLTGDEGSGGLFALNFLNKSADNIFGFGWFSFPSFFFYIQSIAIRIFGQSINALRIWSSLVGAGTVVIAYVAGKKLFSNRIGLIAAIFLAGSHFHIHFSRLGLNNIWDGFWFLFILFLVNIGMRTKNNNALLVAGLSLGFAQYFYVSSRALYILLPVWAIAVNILEKADIKEVIRQLGLVFIASAVVLFPLGANFIKHPDVFWAPFQRATIFDGWIQAEAIFRGQSEWQIIATNFWISFSSFTSTNLRSWYTPDSPILRGFSAGFFLLGLVFVISRIRKSESIMLLLWLLGFVFTGAFSDSTPAAQRYVAVMPALALIVAIGISESFDKLGEYIPNLKKSFIVFSLTMVTLLAINDATFYFTDFTNKGPYGGGNNAIARQLIANLDEKDENWTVAFFGHPRMGYASINSTTFLLPHVTGIDMLAEWGSDENDLPSDKNIFYVFLPEHDENFNLAKADNPNFQHGSEYDENGHLLFTYLVDDN